MTLFDFIWLFLEFSFRLCQWKLEEWNNVITLSYVRQIGIYGPHIYLFVSYSQFRDISRFIRTFITLSKHESQLTCCVREITPNWVFFIDGRYYFVSVDTDASKSSQHDKITVGTWKMWTVISIFPFGLVYYEKILKKIHPKKKEKSKFDFVSNIRQDTKICCFRPLNGL